MTEERHNKVIRIGGISFNKIVVGRRRIVEFKIANPTDNELTVSSIYVQSIHQNNLSTSNPKNGDNVFEITKLPKLPLTLAKKTEVGCAISFSPSHSGWFNGILCVIPSSKHPVQQITLHGEGEFPTSPQQLLPASNSLSLDSRRQQSFISPSKELEESIRAIGTSYTVNGSNFVAKDEDVEPPKQQRTSSFAFSTTSVQNTPNKESTLLTDSWANRFPNSEYANVDTSISKTPNKSALVPHTPTVEIGMDIILQLQKRIQSLEEKFETLSLSLTKERSSGNHDQNSLRNSLEGTEENEAMLSESTAAFLKEMGTPLATRTSQNESWKEFVKAKSPHSPGFANFTANLAKRYETTTPQITALYKTPLWNEELTFQDESDDYSNTPFGKKPRL